MNVGTLAIVTEATKRKSKMSKEDRIIKKDYDNFKAHNSAFAKRWGLDKYDLADNKGLTAKGSALIAGGTGALYGAALAGPAGALYGGLSGALGGAGGTKLGRYMVHKTYGHLDKKNDPDW